MKNVSIFHGHGGTPNSFWFPWLKSELERAGYEVWLPQLPHTENPDLKEWLSFVLEYGKFDEETILVGHSCACPFILSILERIEVKIRKAILVAGFITPLDEKPDPILQESYDWEKIKAHCEEFIIINSDNDPWGCDDKQGRAIFDRVGGTLIIRHGEGHMGSDTFNQPYKEFPLLLRLI